MFGTRLKAGELVRVRSREEILASLDGNGCLDELPIMPEMLRFCGRTMRVQARAHKTCDTVNNTGGVRVRDAVHLENARCDGTAHDGCQAACLMFWKGAWIERVSAENNGDARTTLSEELPELPRDWSYKSPPGTPDADIVYRCQATEIPAFTRPMQWWDIRQYVADITSRNIGFRELFRGMWDSLSYAVISLGVGYRLWKRLYNTVQRLRGADMFYWERGKLSKTPSQTLDLQPDEWVRIKPFDEIMQTLDTENRNRGMGFDIADGIHCKKIAQVDQRIERIIDERTGKMVIFTEPTVTLQGVYCKGERAHAKRFCPRAITPYCREIWLERITPLE